ncbi:MAG: TonB-dependent receptor [Flavobacteriaceae bacterium]|nr:TonB-dependent receptor [Flavobacteriaceae bacterium]
MKGFIYVIFLIPIMMNAQESVKGVIYEQTENNQRMPLPGANVIWLNTTVGTITEDDGTFSVPYSSEYKKLVISFVGFKTDTLEVNNPAQRVEHVLEASTDLEEVKLTGRQQSTAKSYLQSQNIITVSSEELLKAACCNLSESFETNPSIDVNFSDAVTGTRQIKMLGLTSPYILIATENIPSIRGASQAYGLSFIPGTWVESIQITKGAGSVINGYESIAGQINAELRKPSLDDKLFVNFYAAANGRLELNTHLNTRLGEKWHTGLYVHGNLRDSEFDRNDDNFLDVPLKKQINLMNRWQYTDPEKGFVYFLNLRFLDDRTQSGELGFDPDVDQFSTDIWGSEINTQRFELSSKLGYVNPELPFQSLGVQFSFSRHDQDSYFGLRPYDIKHTSIYSNFIYNSIIGDSRHKVKTGLSFTYDHYDELADQLSFGRNERSFGGFFEYSYDDLEDLILTAGLRFDTHNLLGEFVTPRFHLRYTPWERSAFRISFGRGKRSANIFTENQKLFATSRMIMIDNEGGSIYGLDPEIAWNYGLSFLKGFNLFGRKGDLMVDFYRTEFQNQVVVDWENPQQVQFYNLDGSSSANSFQIEFNHNTFEGFDLRMAYKFYDVETDYDSGRLTQPLTPKHRLFANAGYETFKTEKGEQWKFDLTFNWLGEQRFPDTSGNPEAYRLDASTPTYATLNAQITKVFSPKFELYLGGENITNVKQMNPILAANDPFGPNFDSTFVYGPIFGSMFYTGLRLRIN